MNKPATVAVLSLMVRSSSRWRARRPLSFAIVVDSSGSMALGLRKELAIFAMAAKNITNELQHEYVLGYTPSKPLDGKYRKLKVELNRRGLYLRHRGGYLAMPSMPAPIPKPQIR
jgi:hypothetical protein